jgi:hypothetical protein
MGSIVDFLGIDHRACDDLFAVAEVAVARNDWDAARTLFGLQLLHATAPLLVPAALLVADTGIAAGVLLFALATLRLQAKRRGRLPDSLSISGASA